MTAIGVSFKYRLTQQEGNMKKVVVAAVLRGGSGRARDGRSGVNQVGASKAASASNADTALDRSAARHAFDRR